MEIRINCHVVRQGDGTWCTTCTIPTRGGDVKVRAVVPEAAFRGLVGGGFSLRKLVRLRSIASALRQVRAITHGPLGIIIPPQVTAAIDMVHRIQQLRVRHAKGDRDATARLQLAARSRNPAVQRAANATVQLFGDLSHVQAAAEHAAEHDDDEAAA